MRTVEKYEVIEHGIENSSYFQGCGTAFTEYEDCFTGCGTDSTEAFNDALDQLAEVGYAIPAKLETYAIDGLEVPEEYEDCYVYISIRIK